MGRMRRGQGRREDLDIMLEVVNSIGIIPGTTICGLADGAAWPVKNAITKFRAEFEEFIKTHQAAPHGVTPLQEVIAHGQSADRSNTPLPILPGPVAALRSPHAN